MVGRTACRIALGIAALLCLSATRPAEANPATAPAQSPPAGEQADFYANPSLRTLHIRLSAEAWKRMQPDQRPRFEPRRPSPPAEPPAPADAQSDDAQARERIVRSPFGYGYAAAAGTLDVDGETGIDISIRFKGNLSYSLSARSPRRPMKISFNRTDSDRRYQGLATLNLNNSATDVSMLREPLGYALFRDAGVVAPRTAFALAYLTVEGLYDREFLGLYTLVEQVDREFLRRRFGDDAGMLLKPEMVRGLPYMGGDWAHYHERYDPRGRNSQQGGEAFIEMLRLVHFGDDATFRQRIGSFINLDSFMRFIAVQAMIVNFDSFLTTGHNYYLYHDPRDGRFVWMPWDLDLSFGGFVVVAPPPQQETLSVFRPYVPPNRLIARLLSIEELRQAYEGHVRQIAAEVFTAERIGAHLGPMREHLQQAGSAARQANRLGAPTTRPVGLDGAPRLDRFIARRLEAIAAQLAGKDGGFVPAELKGLSLAAGWVENRNDSMMQTAAMALRSALPMPIEKPRLVAAAREWVGESGMTERALVEALAGVLPVPHNFIFDPGPGVEWAHIVMRLADTDKNGHLSPDELAAAIEAAFARADANKDGRLNDAELSRALLRHASQR